MEIRFLGRDDPIGLSNDLSRVVYRYRATVRPAPLAGDFVAAVRLNDPRGGATAQLPVHWSLVSELAVSPTGIKLRPNTRGQRRCFIVRSNSSAIEVASASSSSPDLKIEGFQWLPAGASPAGPDKARLLAVDFALGDSPLVRDAVTGPIRLVFRNPAATATITCSVEAPNPQG